jgi:hypothetical protein
LYNIDYYYDAFPIDWTLPYNLDNEIKIIETPKEFYGELSNRYKDSFKFNFLDNMKAIGINGSIKKLQKWVIEGCWNIVQSNNIAQSTNKIINLNKINKKINYKKKYYDISGSYNLFLNKDDKEKKLLKIKKNYTPNKINNLKSESKNVLENNVILDNNSKDIDSDYDNMFIDSDLEYDNL